jgi:predicted acyltransferase
MTISVMSPSLDISEESSHRLISLDAFRGFAIAGMLFVNNPGTWNPAVVPHQLMHAEWHGCTFADLIFPFFLFIVGVAMAISYQRKHDRGLPWWKGMLIALRRGLLLYLLGALLKSASLNVPVLHFGILQRIGVLYVVAYFLLPLGREWQAGVAVAMLFIWWGLMEFVGAPAVITGSYDRGVNIAQYIDSFILAPDDKETIVSMIPGLSTVLIGILAGRFIHERKDHRAIARMLMIAGVSGIILGLVWSTVVPLNKILWSSSFAVYTAGWSCLVLGIFYWFIEVRGYRQWAFPLVVFGMNAITLYVATGLFVRWIMLSWKVPWEGVETSLTGFSYRSFSAFVGPVGGSLLYSMVVILLGWLLCFWMYRKRLFLRV